MDNFFMVRVTFPLSLRRPRNCMCLRILLRARLSIASLNTPPETSQTRRVCLAGRENLKSQGRP